MKIGDVRYIGPEKVTIVGFNEIVPSDTLTKITIKYARLVEYIDEDGGYHVCYFDDWVTQTTEEPEEY